MRDDPCAKRDAPQRQCNLQAALILVGECVEKGLITLDGATVNLERCRANVAHFEARGIYPSPAHVQDAAFQIYKKLGGKPTAKGLDSLQFSRSFN